MTSFLLDVNVLIALVDPAHLQHETAHEWFARTGRRSFATCPITENALLRIVGHPKYPNSPGPPSTVVPALLGIRALAGHQFWAGTISIADAAVFDPGQFSSHSRITDSYLLALAKAHGGKLATLDRRLTADAVFGGVAALAQI